MMLLIIIKIKVNRRMAYETKVKTLIRTYTKVVLKVRCYFDKIETKTKYPLSSPPKIKQSCGNNISETK